MKDIIQKYQKYLFKGEWHIHTHYTDGKNTIFDYCRIAKKFGIPLLAFTEHVRSTLTYDFEEYLNDIGNAREQFPELEILSGCEAKVLPNGKLDCKDDILQKCDYRIFGFHKFPSNLSLYLKCVVQIIENVPINTWAHPGLFLRKNKLILEHEDLVKIFNVMKDKNVFLEINYKYKLPCIKWISLYKRVVGNDRFVFGGDIHSIKNLVASYNHKKRAQYLQKQES